MQFTTLSTMDLLKTLAGLVFSLAVGIMFVMVAILITVASLFWRGNGLKLTANSTPDTRSLSTSTGSGAGPSSLK